MWFGSWAFYIHNPANVTPFLPLTCFLLLLFYYCKHSPLPCLHNHSPVPPLCKSFYQELINVPDLQLSQDAAVQAVPSEHTGDFSTHFQGSISPEECRVCSWARCPQLRSQQSPLLSSLCYSSWMGFVLQFCLHQLPSRGEGGTVFPTIVPLHALLPPGKERFLQETVAAFRSWCLMASLLNRGQNKQLTSEEKAGSRSAGAEGSAVLTFTGDKLQQEPAWQVGMAYPANVSG